MQGKGPLSRILLWELQHAVHDGLSVYVADVVLCTCHTVMSKRTQTRFVELTFYEGRQAGSK